MYTQYGAFLENIDQFDPQFFGISPREAVGIDPQQRILLEVTWEALEHSGQAPEKLRGSQTGVFLGFFMENYSRLSTGDRLSIDAYNSLGSLRPLAAGRLAYLFDWQGPTLQVNTACSSSLAAMHLACQSLRAKESNLALAGGVNLILTPEETIGLCKLKALSPDGHCKTFDAAANGYVRGEGCGMVVLKRLSDALADRDNILALIKGSAINHDGRSNGITAPNGPAQETVIRQAIKKAKVEVKDIQYIETHGTGTSLGDPIEVLALSKVLGAGRPKDIPLHIGSVKTNFGHLEGAAGVAALMKVVLALQHQEIPPHLHFQTPNPYIPWEQIPVRVTTEAIPWSEKEKPRLAGVSSFGMSGTNVHLIIEQAPRLQTATPTIERPLHILNLSARNQEALQSLAKSYEVFLDTYPEVSLTDLCFTANSGRSHFEHRLAIITSDKQELSNKLAKISAGEETSGVFSGILSSNRKSPKIVFLFTGQGSQYVNMGRQLYETQPVFRRTLDKCEQILQSYLEKSLLDVLYPEDSQEINSSIINQTAYTQPALFAIEYALFQLWQSWGIKPDVVMGHSVGEYVAATVAGVFSLEDGLKLIAHRGRLMQRLPSGGEMVAVMTSEKKANQLIAPYIEEVTIAAINGPESVVISGSAEVIRTLFNSSEAQGIKTKQLQVSHAFHSPLMKPVLADFAAVTDQITYNKPQIPLISNTTGNRADDSISAASYWVNHVSQPVKFAQSMETLQQEGYEVFLEIGSKPILLGMGRQCLLEGAEVWLPSLRSGQEDWQPMLHSLGKLYVQGVKVDWLGFDRDYFRSKIVLPSYPFQRQRYWIETLKKTAKNGEQKNGEQKNGALSLENETTQIINLLHQGKTEVLVKQLAKVENFTKSEAELLPKLLELLVKEHQQQLTTASLKDWLYEVQWKAKARFRKILPLDDLVAPVEIKEQLSSTLTKLVTEKDLERSKEIPTQLEQLSIDYVIKALQEIGWFYKPQEHFSFPSVIKSLGIIPSQQQLFRRMLQMLTEVGIVKQNKQDWLVLKTLKEVNIDTLSQSLLSQYPDTVAELTLLHRCASQLSEVLQGAVDPMQLVFPEGDLTIATQLYQESTVAKVMNTLVQKAIASAINKLPPSRGVRLLEIGAGTGGTTSYILPHLNPSQTEYVFTDLGALFTAKAQEKFLDYPFVFYQKLDIEIDPISQGFVEHQYDVIIAANVLHATTNIKQTLSHVRKLLAPKGMLVLLEVTTRQRWLDLIFGLLEGWWKFQDTELRPDHPLLSRTKWKQVLSENGFAQVVTLPDLDGLPEVLSQQSVIIAQAQETTLENTSSNPKTWLVMADQRGFSQELAAQLTFRGDVCNLVFAGEQYQEIAPQSFTINPDNPTDYVQLLATISTVTTSNSIEILNLWSLDSHKVEQLTVETLESASKFGCVTVLHLVQALLKTEFNQQPRLWLVTQEAQPVQGTRSSMAGLAQSSVWGMGRVISLEHPELWGGMLDLDSNSSIDQSVTNLITEIYDSDGEDHVAFRDGQRYLARLMDSSHLETSQGFEFQSNGTYLITGGLGFLGLKLAQWMVEQGASNIVLIGRKGLPQRQDWGNLANNSKDKKKIEIIQFLESKGAKLSIFSADVTDLDQMSSVIERINTGENPLKGIVHAAGITHGLVMEQMQSQALESVLRPKTLGTWILHQLTKHLNLDCFICFSSAGSVWGAKGQADYDAANHFLDTFAYYRRSIGLPALSINWGSLGVGGLVSEESYVQWMKMLGLEALQPEQGFNALGWLLETDAVQTVVAQVEWSKFKAIYQYQKQRPLLAEIESKVEEEQEQFQLLQQKPDILQQLNSGTETLRHQKLTSYIQSEVAKVLDMKDLELLSAEQSLFDMGLDSLMMVELRNRLEVGLNCSLPATLAFEFPNIASLTEYIGSRILGWEFSKTDAQNLITNSVKNSATDWIAYHQPNPHSRLRLFCFHHLGGAASVFREWSNILPSDIEVCPVQLPGREARFREQPFTQFFPLIETLAQVISPYIDKPFAFYGHSLGTLICFELAHFLRQQYDCSPVHLLVSGSNSPDTCFSKWKSKSSSPEQMLNFFLKISEIPQAIRDDQSLLEELMLIFKADVQLSQSYLYSKKELLDCPISALGGTDDPLVNLEELAGWRQHTNSIFKLS